MVQSEAHLKLERCCTVYHDYQLIGKKSLYIPRRPSLPSYKRETDVPNQQPHGAKAKAKHQPLTLASLTPSSFPIWNPIPFRAFLPPGFPYVSSNLRISRMLSISSLMLAPISRMPFSK